LFPRCFQLRLYTPALVAAEPEKIFAPLGVPLTSDGILSLYTGLLPNLVKEGPPLALYLGIYEVGLHTGDMSC
jgi:hypothetical protein